MVRFPESGIVRLKNPIRNYAWGSRTVIARFQGRSVPSELPEAELWIGAHPSSPSTYALDGTEWTLEEAVAHSPDVLLGDEVSKRFGGMLPFLVKILAVEEALSLQVHPDEAAARAGFDREEHAGIAVDAPQRNYRDRRGKPELVSALTQFDALIGFREPRSAAALIELLESSSLLEAIGGCGTPRSSDDMARAFKSLYALSRDRASQLVGEVADRAKRWSERDLAYRWISVLHDRHPADVAVLSPLFLNCAHLEPGQAALIEPGEVHAYLRGSAVEVTGNSDNVVRAGLTGKHVDVGGFMELTHFSCGPARTLDLEHRSARELLYPTGFSEFEVGILRAGAGERLVPVRRRCPEILLCTRGSGLLSIAPNGARLPFEMGAAFFVSTSAGCYGIEGDGELYRVSVPMGEDDVRGHRCRA